MKAIEEKKREEALNPTKASSTASALPGSVPSPEDNEEEEDEKSRKTMEIIREEEGMEVDEEPDATGAASGGMGGVSGGGAMSEDRRHANGGADSSGAFHPFDHQGWDRGAVLFAMSKKPQRRTFQTTTEDQDRGLLSVFRRDDETMLKQRREVLSDQREKDPAFVSDTYAECYPGFGSEVAYLGYDSDEEGERKDTARVDTGEYRIIHKDKNQQFKSKEEYEKYIGEIEFVPKAALQYGRRFAGDINASRKKRKMNVDQEWKKIEGMIKERKAAAVATTDNGA
ncbi:red family protein [Cystoisospora suis]|uniref:Red family protein n=1 Tax=Cystoisospora suis TaxID=483139 RepID=A0A2C6L6D1_9APIC|nr:red family protein [Cystoisospora suis]